MLYKPINLLSVFAETIIVVHVVTIIIVVDMETVVLHKINKKYNVN